MLRLILCFMLVYTSALGQRYFNVISDHGGATGQSMHYVVMVEGDTIYTIGDNIDSARTAIRPYIAQYSLEGDLLTIKYLVDSNYIDDFVLAKRQPEKKEDYKYYYCSNRDNGHNSRYDYNLMEIDIRSGEIIRSHDFVDSIYGYFMDMYYSSESACLTLAFNDNKPGPDFISIVEIDANFNIKRHLKLDLPYPHIPYYIEKNEDNVFEIMGDTRIFASGRNDEDSARIFYMTVDTAGIILSYKQHVYSQKVLFGHLATYTINRNAVGDWLFTALEFIQQSPTDWNAFPVSFRADKDFQNVSWEKPFFDTGYFRYPRVNIESSVLTPDESAFLTVGDLTDESGSGAYGWVYKTSVSGKVLWARQYLPTGVDFDGMIHADLRHIIQSPESGYIVTGAFSERYEHRWHSWLLRIDEDGCIVPDCGNIVDTDDEQGKAQHLFKIHPNPASHVLYLLSYVDVDERYDLELYDLSGRVVERTFLRPKKGAQFVFFFEEAHVAGSYVLLIKNERGEVVQREKVIIQ